MPPTLFILILAAIATLLAGCFLYLLRREEKKSAQLRGERDEALLRAQSTEKRYDKRIDELHLELRESRQFARDLELFGNTRIVEVERLLRGANAVVEMLVEKLPNDNHITINRDEARRLFVS